LPFGNNALLDKWCNELFEGFTASGKKLRAMVKFIFTESTGSQTTADAAGFFKQGNFGFV